MIFKRRPLVAGNWKMNGRVDFAKSFADDLVAKVNDARSSHFDLLLCPPATLLSPVADKISEAGIFLGGQDCHVAANGAHTGDISAEMLKDLGCTYTIIGHSERRTDHFETNEIVKSKAEAALIANLIAIICIGETEIERKNGATNEIVMEQIVASIPKQANSGNIVIAYEPVWAIGTGRTPSAKEVQDVHALMRKTLSERIGNEQSTKTRLLYGGSVKPGNAIELMSLPDVDGALVGGASLSDKDFLAIAESCPK